MVLQVLPIIYLLSPLRLVLILFDFHPLLVEVIILGARELFEISRGYIELTLHTDFDDLSRQK